jgi:hypothetical protein
MKKFNPIAKLGLVCLSFFALFQAEAQGNCTSFDLDYICKNTEYVQNVSLDCGLACLNDGEECLVACMTEQLALTNGCIGCFGEQVTCIVQSCFLACAFGSEEDCAECALANCEAGFNECAGIVDNDSDDWTNLCDCNDNNPNVYPGADGTNQGFDNNCNGIYSPTETTNCLADLNSDNTVGTADLLIFLGTFDCTSNCVDEADMNSDGVIGASDLLIFLSEFGLGCN